jgi:hypothetical protein
VRPYGELERDARDKPAFSNSTDGYAWLDNWCGDCIHDKPAREGDEGNGCPLILVALVGKTPAEWLDQWDGKSPFPLGNRYHCIEYRPEDDGGGDSDPLPEPIPGQGELLPREPYEGVRMFADVVAENASRVVLS